MNFDINLILVPLLMLSGAILLFSSLAGLRRGNKLSKPATASKATKSATSKAADTASDIKVPWWLDYSRSLFPIILLVVVIRSFIIEPYQIPSSSMVPTLVKGDFILVKKFSYGLRTPLSNHEIVSFGKPHRGDIIVFNFPADPKTRYIKRVIGQPGDIINYYNKTLTINGEEIEASSVRIRVDYQEFSETLTPDKPPHIIRKHHFVSGNDLPQSSWQVPPKHYFVMGDNRDNSNDSRYWGFVPHDALVGQAFLIWMNWEASNQLPTFSRSGLIY